MLLYESGPKQGKDTLLHILRAAAEEVLSVTGFARHMVEGSQELSEALEPD